MAQPVWVLSVDLQTKTATFQSGMAEAARSARTAFQEIKSGSADMGEGVSHGSLDIRHSLGLVDNVIRGAHAQAMADLIRMYAQSALVMTALPIAATVAGFALIGGIVYAAFKHVQELKEEQEKLANSMTELDTAAESTFQGLSLRILEAQKRADDLNNNTLGALHKELEIIDHQSFAELLRSFETIDKAAVAAFGDIKKHWYDFGAGAEGATHALTQFRVQYENLLAKGDSKGASDLLAGTRQSAETTLKAMQATKGDWSGATDKELAAQQAILAALNGQFAAAKQIADLQKADEGNATKSTGNEMSARAAAGAHAAAQSQLKMGMEAVAADKATADAQAEIKRESIEQRLDLDVSFAGRERDVQLAANTAEIAALDKSGKDYNNQYAALKRQQTEIAQQFATTSATLAARASVETYQRDLAATEEGIRAGIELTRQGSAERLAAISAAMKQEEALGLQDTENYRELQTQKAEVTRQFDEENRKLASEAAVEEGAQTEKMGMLQLSAAKVAAALQDSMRRMTMAQRITEETDFAHKEAAIHLTALHTQAAALDKSSKDYDNKLKEIQNKELQTLQQFENKKAEIKAQAEIQINQKILGAQDAFANAMASSLMSVIEGHQSFASAMDQLGKQVVEGVIENTLKMILSGKLMQASDASVAASHVYAQVSGWPVVGPFLAPVLAGAAFAGVMAFETGTDRVPGVGRGDIVPAKLTPGEGVVPGGVMDGLRTMARNGKMTGGEVHQHMHYKPTFHVNTIDATGVRQMLRQHTQEFTAHYHREARKLNR